MRILIAIVHHWNPHGDGRHASLRRNPEPRRLALQAQLLSLRRMSTRQGIFDFSDKTVLNANQAIRHCFDLRVVTDGENTVLDLLEKPYREMVTEEVRKPESPKHLGFEAQKLLAENQDQGFDLLVYLEDDLLVLDAYFFQKIAWFSLQAGPQSLLLPHRVEMPNHLHNVDRLFIDGSIPKEELQFLIPDPPSPLSINLGVEEIFFQSPLNPHAGCFALTPIQMKLWSQNACWQDGDCSYISPLESAATLGLVKMFTLYKPAVACASWLEIQHWGTSFHSLIGK